MRWKSVLVAALLLTSSAVLRSAETALQERPELADAMTVLDQWISQQMAYRDLPGLSIAVVHDQGIVWAKGYGYADLAEKTPATPDTVYRIGSISKLFTSTAILHLRDRGKLRLDDPVAMHLPWFRVPNPFPDAPEITIRQLLTHTSGLAREADVPYWTDHVFPSLEQLKEVVVRQDVIQPPETTYHYSNLGMSLLGEVVAEVSGQSWADYVAENIFRPLGMASSSGEPGDELMTRRAVPYMLRGPDGKRAVFDYYDTGAIAPAANVVSTVEDLCRFASLQFRDGPAGGEQILKGSTLREMQRPHWVYDSFSGGRGLGFYVSHRDGKSFVGHGGWIGGNRSHLLFVPSEKIAVVAALNSDDGVPVTFANQAYEVMAPVLLKETGPPPATPVEEPDPAWQRYLGVYSDPWGWETEVMILGGDLVLYSRDYPPDDDASAGFTRLKPMSGTTFVMPDKEVLSFELDDDGKVERIKKRNDYLYPKHDD